MLHLFNLEEAKEMEEYLLLEQFKHYKLDFLIPRSIDSDDYEEEQQEEIYSEECIDEDVEYEEVSSDNGFDEDGNVKNLDTLLWIFDRDYMEPEEFLNTPIWEFFEISKKQFDLIDWKGMMSEQFYDFYSSFLELPKSIPIEKRIKYAKVNSFSYFYNMSLPEGFSVAEYKQYAYRLVDTHSFEESIHIFPLLRDYYRFYEDALEMNRRREAEGRTVFKYVFKPKASHLWDLHNKAYRDHIMRESERMASSLEDIDKRIKSVSQSKDYTRFLFEDDMYAVLPATSQQDLTAEGTQLQHCVASYGGLMANCKSYIFFVRRQDERDKPYFTAEIVPEDSPKDPYTLQQFYTFRDTTKKPESLADFVYKWAKTKKFKIQCKI